MPDRGGRPERPLRVAHVVFDLHGGGMESLVAAMAQRFAGSSVVMSVITLSGRVGRVGAVVRPLVEQFHVLKPVPGVSMLWPLGLVRCLRGVAPDVVHLHSGAWYKGALAARLAGVRRVVYTEHGRSPDEPLRTRWLDRWASRWTDVVVAVSDPLQRYLETGVGVSSGRIRTIVNAIDVGAFTPGARPLELLDRLGIPRDAFVIGSVGRLEPVKAYERMIEALVQVRDGGELSRPIYLVICGEGSHRPALEEYARRRGVADYARFPGWVDRPTDVYRMLDVFALTSLSEGASVSLMESMACGAAPVVMAVGGNADILGAELRDQAVPAGDVAAFGRAVVATLRSPDRLERVRRIARARAAERYGLDRLIGAYERVYRALSDLERDVSPVHAERPVGDGQVEGGDDRARPILAQ